MRPRSGSPTSPTRTRPGPGGGAHRTRPPPTRSSRYRTSPPGSAHRGPARRAAPAQREVPARPRPWTEKRKPRPRRGNHGRGGSVVGTEGGRLPAKAPQGFSRTIVPVGGRGEARGHCSRRTHVLFNGGRSRCVPGVPAECSDFAVMRVTPAREPRASGTSAGPPACPPVRREPPGHGRPRRAVGEGRPAGRAQSPRSDTRSSGPPRTAAVPPPCRRPPPRGGTGSRTPHRPPPLAHLVPARPVSTRAGVRKARTRCPGARDRFCGKTIRSGASTGAMGRPELQGRPGHTAGRRTEPGQRPKAPPTRPGARSSPFPHRHATRARPVCALRSYA